MCLRHQQLRIMHCPGSQAPRAFPKYANGKAYSSNGSPVYEQSCLAWWGCKGLPCVQAELGACQQSAQLWGPLGFLEFCKKEFARDNVIFSSCSQNLPHLYKATSFKGYESPYSQPQALREMLSSCWDKGPVAHEERPTLPWRNDKTQCISIILAEQRPLQLPCFILYSLSCHLYKGKDDESVAQTCSQSEVKHECRRRACAWFWMPAEKQICTWKLEKTWSGRNRSKYVSLDEGMRLIRKGREDAASDRIEHMET